MKNIIIYDTKRTSLSVANDVRNTKLKGNEYRIYHYLALGADDKTGECERFLGRISFDTGLHKDTVRRVIKRLVNKGLILMQMRKNQFNNENASNLYTICEMLTEDALAIKKAYIEEYPVIKMGVDVVADLVSKTIDKLNNKSTETVEETTELEESVEVETAEEVVEEEVVETPYERFKRIKREEMLLDLQRTDEEVVMLGRSYGFDLTKEQARSLHRHYSVSRIESAFVRGNIKKINTYYYVQDLLQKQEEERVKKHIILNPYLSKLHNIAE